MIFQPQLVVMFPELIVRLFVCDSLLFYFLQHIFMLSQALLGHLQLLLERIGLVALVHR